MAFNLRTDVHRQFMHEADGGLTGLRNMLLAGQHSMPTEPADADYFLNLRQRVEADRKQGQIVPRR